MPPSPIYRGVQLRDRALVVGPGARHEALRSAAISDGSRLRLAGGRERFCSGGGGDVEGEGRWSCRGARGGGSSARSCEATGGGDAWTSFAEGAGRRAGTGDPDESASSGMRD